MIDQFVGQTDRIRRTHRTQGAFWNGPQIAAGFPEENSSAIHPKNAAHQEQEFFEQTLRV